MLTIILADNELTFDPSQWSAATWAVIVLLPLVVIGLGWLLLGKRRTIVRPSLPDPFQREAAPSSPDPFEFGSSQERRASLRRGGNPVPVFLSDAEARAAPYPGWVVDRSMGGLCISVEEAVTPGTILSIRAANAPAAIPWIQIEVRNCRSADDRWELGCRFLRTPPWGTLLLFG